MTFSPHALRRGGAGSPPPMDITRHQAAAQTTAVLMGFNSNIGTRATDINSALALSGLQTLSMSSAGYTCHSHQFICCPAPWGRLLPLPPAKPKDTTKAVGTDTDFVHPCGSQGSSWPGTAAWNHSGPSRRSNQSLRK